MTDITSQGILSPGTQDQELDDELRRDRSYGLLGLLSGDRVLSKIGEEKLRRTDRSLYGRIHVGDGFFLDKATGRVAQDPGYAEFLTKQDELKENRAARLQEQILERMGVGANLRARQPQFTTKETEGGVAPVQFNPLAAGGARAEPIIPLQRPVSEGSAQLAAAAERTANDLRALQEQLERNPGAISMPKEILKDIAGAPPIVGGTLREGVEGSVFTQEEQQIRARAQSVLNEYVKALSGAAVSAQEIERIKAAFPFAPGVSFEAALARLPAFIESMESNAAAIRGANTPRSAPSPAPPQERKRVRVDREGNVIGN